ncbi:MAG: hypothetical protein WC542_11270 [Paludibacter sp.]
MRTCGTDTQHVPFAGASLSQSEKVNAGANTAKCIACPDLSGSTSR